MAGGMTEDQGPIGPGPDADGLDPVARRKFLERSAACLVVVAGGLVWRAYDTGVFSTGRGPAYRPWANWQGETAGEGPLAIVRAGILAASAHNTQPWLFRVQSDRIDLFADQRRNLGAMDPFLREMHLSLGCALENMILAAWAKGFEPKVEMMPGRLTGIPEELGMEPVARIRLKAAKAEVPGLYNAIPARRTNRGEYQVEREIPRGLLWAFNDMAREDRALRLILLEAGAARDAFDRLTVAATEAIVADDEMIAASTAWFRLTPEAIEEHRDGPTIDSFGLPSLSLAAVKMLPKPEPGKTHRQWVATTRDVQLATAPLVGFIAVRDLYDRRTALRAGLLWQRLHLWATTQDLAMQPLNQLPEMVDRERQLGRKPEAARGLSEIIEDDRWHPTLAFRAGFPTVSVPPSPRRDVADVVTKGAALSLANPKTLGHTP